MNTYNPNYKIKLSEILQEILDEMKINKLDFANQCGISLEIIDKILNDTIRINKDIALKFERVLGVNAVVWVNLERGIFK